MQHTVEEVKSWETDRVDTWISSISGEAPPFGIDGPALLDLSDERLVELGIVDAMNRVRVLACVAAINDPNHTSGRYGCEYECGFTSDIFDAVVTHEQACASRLQSLYALQQDVSNTLTDPALPFVLAISPISRPPLVPNDEEGLSQPTQDAALGPWAVDVVLDGGICEGEADLDLLREERSKQRGEYTVHTVDPALLHADRGFYAGPIAVQLQFEFGYGAQAGVKAATTAAAGSAEDKRKEEAKEETMGGAAMSAAMSADMGAAMGAATDDSSEKQHSADDAEEVGGHKGGADDLASAPACRFLGILYHFGLQRGDGREREPSRLFAEELGGDHSLRSCLLAAYKFLRGPLHPCTHCNSAYVEFAMLHRARTDTIMVSG
jgi:hypothetical protein